MSWSYDKLPKDIEATIVKNGLNLDNSERNRRIVISQSFVQPRVEVESESALLVNDKFNICQTLGKQKTKWLFVLSEL